MYFVSTHCRGNKTLCMVKNRKRVLGVYCTFSVCASTAILTPSILDTSNASQIKRKGKEANQSLSFCLLIANIHPTRTVVIVPMLLVSIKPKVNCFQFSVYVTLYLLHISKLFPLICLYVICDNQISRRWFLFSWNAANKRRKLTTLHIAVDCIGVCWTPATKTLMFLCIALSLCLVVIFLSLGYLHKLHLFVFFFAQNMFSCLSVTVFKV